MPPGGWQQPPGSPAFQPGQGQLASWGSRVGATLLDGLILTVGVVVASAVIFVGFQIALALGLVLLLLLGVPTLVVWVGYGAILMNREGERNGQTYGKQVVGIRVVRDNGQRMDLGNGLLREVVVKGLLIAGLGSFLFYIPILLDYLWPLWDDTDRSLHDMVVSTHVVEA